MCVKYLHLQESIAYSHLYRRSEFRPEGLRNALSVLRSPKALTFGYGCAVNVGVDVGAGDAEIGVIYITFIVSTQSTGYLVLYKDKVQTGNGTTDVVCTDTEF